MSAPTATCIPYEAESYVYVYDCGFLDPGDGNEHPFLVVIVSPHVLAANHLVPLILASQGAPDRCGKTSLVWEPRPLLQSGPDSRERQWRQP